MNSEASVIMSFQVVEVHKPLWAVSRLVAAGNQVLFDKVDPHILSSTGETVGMSSAGGTSEIEVWIKSPGFARQNTG